MSFTYRIVRDMTTAYLLEDAPIPRLCHITKWTGCDGYGFNLQGFTGESGQFVGTVDPNSAAEATGLKDGDRLIEVNGINVEEEDYTEVVERIKSNTRETSLLVVDNYTYIYYKRRELPITNRLPNIRTFRTPSKPATGIMKPRLCHLKTWRDFIGYGFTLQTQLEAKNPVVFQVDSESPAEYGGLKSGDKIVEMNHEPTYTEDGEVPYERLVALIKSYPQQLRLLVVEERFYNEFVKLRKAGKYKDESIEIIVCPDENPNRNEDITFAIDSLASSVTASPCEPQTHSAPNHMTITDDGSHNDAFVDDETEEIVRLQPTSITPPLPAIRIDSVSSRSSASSHPITFKYFEIRSAKGMHTFGFNVVSERPKPGIYFENIEIHSPAHEAGLKDGNYLVYVNGSLAYKDSHGDAVEKIKLNPDIVKVIVTDAEGFQMIYLKDEAEVWDLIDSNFDFIRQRPSSDFEGENSIETKAEIEEYFKHQNQSEDDTDSIDYKQVAEEMVQLAIQEANQDEIQLQELKHATDDKKDDTLTRSNQLLSAPLNQLQSAVSSQSLEISTPYETGKHDHDYSSLPRSSKTSLADQPDNSNNWAITLAGPKFAATAAEARRNMKKKTDVRNSGMSLKDKYEMLKGL